MKILLIGALGKMGREVATNTQNYGDEISFGVECQEAVADSCYAKAKHDFELVSEKNLSKIDGKNIDAIIDFSTSTDRAKYFEFATKYNIAYGLFSTNFTKNDEKYVKKSSKKIPILVCKNSSLGVNVLYKLAQVASQNLPHSQVVLTEYHHTQKLDMPSGTAKAIEKILSENNIDFQTSAFRVGNEKGYHKIEFFLGDEILTISHRANSRKIFACGALEAMHKLIRHQNGIFCDVLSL